MRLFPKSLFLMAPALIAGVLLIFFGGCEENTVPGEPIDYKAPEPETEETFDIADMPTFDVFEYNQDSGLTYKMMIPWNYDKPHNSGRSYPLIISLHGGTSNKSAYYAPCIVGNEEEMKQYPAFFVAPNSTSGWGSAAAWVRQLIEDLKSEYRVDSNRIYLMGYSRGGSGSYSFASAYWRDHQGLFAGIVRLAGQSQTSLPDPIMDSTSIWYHIGLDDTPTRTRIAEEAYQAVKNYEGNSSAVETIFPDQIDGYSRRTKILTLEGVEIMKKSEYSNVGHSSSVPFSDPSVLGWLFQQTLAGP